MSQANVELVRSAFQRFEAGDMQGVLPYCDENIEIEQPVELPGVPRRQHGHSGVLEAFAVWPEQWDEFRVDVLRLSDIGDDVVVTMLNRGRGKETAIPVESQFTHVFTIRSGKIVRWRIFMHEDEALEAVGLAEQTGSREQRHRRDVPDVRGGRAWGVTVLAGAKEPCTYWGMIIPASQPGLRSLPAGMRTAGRSANASSGRPGLRDTGRAMSENLDLVRSICAAWERRDYDWTEWADPAIEFVVADGPSPGRWTGLAGMWEGWREILSPWEDWRAEDVEYRELDEERVLAIVHFSGRGKASRLDVAQMSGTGANIFQIRRGKVIRLVAYWHRDRALADLGLVEQPVSQENVELAQEAYEALNEALRGGDFQDALKRFCDPDVVLSPSGILPESSEMHGHDGLLQFVTLQTQAFEDFAVEPLEFIDAGDRVVVPLRFGGRASHTGLEVQFDVVHVCTARNGKWTRLDMYPTRSDALEAVGLEQQAMSQENVEIVRRCLDAWSHGDIAAMTALNHPDIEADWSASHSWFAGVYHGNDACMAVVEEYFEAFETLVIEAESYIPAGDAVVVPNIAYLRGREGVHVTARSTFVFTLHERKITKIHLYEQPAEALKAVGLEQYAMSQEPATSDVATLTRPDGTRIAYDDLAGDGPPVVFIHGLTSSRVAWEPVTRLLASDCRCVRVDLRGHGASSPGPEYSTLSLVGDVRAVVEELALGEPAVVGHSLGATTAAVYAALHEVRAVICVDQSLRFGDFAAVVQARADALRSRRTMEAVLAIDRGLQLEPYADVADLERRVLAFPREIVLGIWDALLTTPPAELTAIAEAMLPRIAAPLLSLHGSPPPSDYVAWLTGLVHGAQVEVWDGSGHMLHLVDPERFAARVRPLLADSDLGEQAMSQENVEIVMRLLDAFNARDLDRFSEQTTPDFEWSPSMAAIEGEVFIGRPGIETYFGRMIDGWDSFRVEAGALRDLGDRVLWSGRLDGRGRMSGATVSAPLDILYEVRDGKVSSMRSFLDHNEALKAVGLEEQAPESTGRVTVSHTLGLAGLTVPDTAPYDELGAEVYGPADWVYVQSPCIALHQTTIRFDPEQWKTLRAEAERTGVSVAAYLRETVLASLAFGAGKRYLYRRIDDH